MLTRSSGCKGRLVVSVTRTRRERSRRTRQECHLAISKDTSGQKRCGQHTSNNIVDGYGTTPGIVGIPER